MNAYELADKLEAKLWGTEIDVIYKTATMLRQQAEKINNMEIWEKKYLDRIAELEKQLDKTVFCDFCDPTGEKRGEV